MEWWSDGGVAQQKQTPNVDSRSPETLTPAHHSSQVAIPTCTPSTGLPARRIQRATPNLEKQRRKSRRLEIGQNELVFAEPRAVAETEP